MKIQQACASYKAISFNIRILKHTLVQQTPASYYNNIDNCIILYFLGDSTRKRRKRVITIDDIDPDLLLKIFDPLYPLDVVTPLLSPNHGIVLSKYILYGGMHIIRKYIHSPII